MKQRTRNEGTALIFAIMVLAILSIGTSVLWKQLHQNLEQHRMAWHQEQVFLVAEAGLDTAIARLRQPNANYAGEEDVVVGPGRFTVVVTPDGAARSYRLRSRARLDHVTSRYSAVTLAATLRLSPTGEVIAYAWHIDREGGAS